MNEEQLMFLFENYASDKGFSDYDEFKGLMSDENARKVFFENANPDLGFTDYDEFNTTLGIGDAEGETGNFTEGSGEQQEQPTEPLKKPIVDVDRFGVPETDEYLSGAREAADKKLKETEELLISADIPDLPKHVIDYPSYNVEQLDSALTDIGKRKQILQSNIRGPGISKREKLNKLEEEYAAAIVYKAEKTNDYSLVGDAVQAVKDVGYSSSIGKKLRPEVYNLESRVSEDIFKEIEGVDIYDLTEIDFNGIRRADVDKVADLADKVAESIADGNPGVRQIAYERILNEAEEYERTKKIKEKIESDTETQDIFSKYKTEALSEFESTNDDGIKYRAELVSTVDSINNNVQSRLNKLVLDYNSDVDLYKQELISQVQQGIITNKEANKQLKDYNTQLYSELESSNNLVIENNKKDIEEVSKEYYKKIEGGFSKFLLDNPMDPSDVEKLQASMKKIYEEVDEGEFAYLKEKENLQSLLFGGTTSLVASFGKTYTAELGRAIASKGTFFNQPWMTELGDEMMTSFSVADERVEDWSDLANVPAVVKSVGRLAGSATTSIAVGAIASTATAGLGTIPAMAAVATASGLAESVDMVGGIKRDIIRETGSLLKGEQGAEAMWKAQMGNWWTYLFDGLPYVGKALRGISSKAAKIGVVGLESSITETIQETRQTAQEQKIMESVMSGEEISARGFGELITPGLVKSTFLEVAPGSFFLGASGRAVTEFRMDGQANQIVRELIDNAALNGVDENKSFIKQKIFSSMNRYGKHFTNSWLAILQKGGAMTQEELAELYTYSKTAEGFVRNIKNTKLTKDQANTYFGLSHRANELFDQAEAITDDKVLKSSLNEEANKLKKNAQEFLSDPETGGSFVTVKIGSNPAVVLTESEAIELVEKNPYMASKDVNITIDARNAEEFATVFNGLLANAGKTPEQVTRESKTNEVFDKRIEKLTESFDKAIAVAEKKYTTTKRADELRIEKEKAIQDLEEKRNKSLEKIKTSVDKQSSVKAEETTTEETTEEDIFDDEILDDEISSLEDDIKVEEVSQEGPQVEGKGIISDKGKKYEVQSIDTKKDGSKVVKAKEVIEVTEDNIEDLQSKRKAPLKVGDKIYGTIKRYVGQEAEVIAKDNELSKGEIKEPTPKPAKRKFKGRAAPPTPKVEPTTTSSKVRLDVKERTEEDIESELNEEIAKIEAEAIEFEQMVVDELSKSSPNRDMVQVGENLYQVTKKPDGTYTVSKMRTGPEGRLVGLRQDSKEKSDAIAEFERVKRSVEEKALSEAEKLVEKNKKESEDKILKFLNQAIEDTSSGKLRGQLNDVTIVLGTTAANAALRGVRAAYKAGLSLSNAIKLQYEKLQNTGVTELQFKKFVLDSIKKSKGNINSNIKEKPSPKATPKVTPKATPKISQESSLVRPTSGDIQRLKDTISKLTDDNKAREIVAKGLRELLKNSKLNKFSKRTINKTITSLKNAKVSNMQAMLDKVDNAIAEDEKRVEREKSLKNRAKAIKNISNIGSLKELQGSFTQMIRIDPTELSKKSSELYDSVINDIININKKNVDKTSRANFKAKIDKVLELYAQEQKIAEDVKERIENKINPKKTISANLKKFLKDDLISKKEYEIISIHRNILEETTVVETLENETEEDLKKRAEDALAEKREAIELRFLELSALPQFSFGSDGSVARFNLTPDERKYVKEAGNLTLRDIEQLNLRDAASILLGIEAMKFGFVTPKLVSGIIKVRGNKQQMSVPINEIKSSGFIDKITSRVSAAFKNLFIKSKADKKTAIGRRLRRVPMKNINQVLKVVEEKEQQGVNDFKSTNIYTSLFKPSSNKISELDNHLQRDKVKFQIALSLLSRNQNERFRQSALIQLYMVQREYDSNEDNVEVNQAMAWAKETIKNLPEIYGETEQSVLESLINNKKYTTKGKDGVQIDAAKIFESLTNKEKKYISILDEVYDKLGPMAEADAMVQGMTYINRENYVHLPKIKVRDSKTGFEEDLDSLYNRFTNPSVKNKAASPRTGKVHSISFDPIANAAAASRKIGTGYYMYPAVKSTRVAFSGLKNRAETKFEKELVTELESIYDLMLRSQFQSLKNNGSPIVDFLLKAGYLSQLGGVVKAASELATNTTHALMNNGASFSQGVSTISSVDAETMDKAIQNLPTTQMSRVTRSAMYQSQNIEAGLLQEAQSFKSVEMKGELGAALMTVADFAKIPFKKAIKFNESLITKPDELVIRPLLVGVVQSKFNEITGQKLNWDSMANDEAYRSKFSEAINKATEAADTAVIDTSASTNIFDSIPANMKDPDANAWIAAFQVADRYMSNFRVFEYYSAVKGIQNLFGKGEITKGQAVMLLTSTVARMAMYRLIIDSIFGLLFTALGIDDEDDEIDETDVTKNVLGAVVTLAFGRNLGNVSTSIVNAAVEYVNKELGEGITYEGEYNPYAGIVFNKFGGLSKSTDPAVDFIIANTGPFSNTVKTNLRAISLMNRAINNEKKESRDKNLNELLTKTPIDFAGSLAIIPSGKTIKRVMNKYYHPKEKEKKEKEKKEKGRDTGRTVNQSSRSSSTSRTAPRSNRTI